MVSSFLVIVKTFILVSFIFASFESDCFSLFLFLTNYFLTFLGLVVDFLVWVSEYETNFPFPLTSLGEAFVGWEWWDFGFSIGFLERKVFHHSSLLVSVDCRNDKANIDWDLHENELSYLKIFLYEHRWNFGTAKVVSFH